MRLIDRNELEAFGATCKSQDYMDGVKDLLEYIDNLPPVDAVPVSFIQQRIDQLQNIADFALESNGGYIESANSSLYELKLLLSSWKAEQSDTPD